MSACAHECVNTSLRPIPPFLTAHHYINNKIDHCHISVLVDTKDASVDLIFERHITARRCVFSHVLRRLSKVTLHISRSNPKQLQITVGRHGSDRSRRLPSPVVTLCPGLVVPLNLAVAAPAIRLASSQAGTTSLHAYGVNQRFYGDT